MSKLHLGPSALSCHHNVHQLSGMNDAKMAKSLKRQRKEALVSLCEHLDQSIPEAHASDCSQYILTPLPTPIFLLLLLFIFLVICFAWTS